MSFSLWVTVKHPDGYWSTFNIVDGQTYNLLPMWQACGLIPENKGTRWLDGKTCAEMLPLAKAAALDYLTNRAKYEALDPANGWGDHKGFWRNGLRPFLETVAAHPTGIIEWSG